MDPIDSYSPDSKKAEYLEAMYTEKSNTQSEFLLRHPSIQLEDGDAVIDLTNNDRSGTFDRIQMRSSTIFSNFDDVSKFDDDFVPNDRPHSDFFSGNAEIIEHFGKDSEDRDQELSTEVSTTRVSPQTFHFEQELERIEKSLPLIDMGDSADSLIPDKNVGPSKFSF
jgi:hypothetical protein